MSKGRRGEDRLLRTMRWPRPTMTLPALCVTFLALQSISDAAAISPGLPTSVFMKAIIVVDQQPLNLDNLSLRWEHNGRPLVEYRHNNVTAYDPRVSMPEEQFKDGNFSLTLMNLTTKDTGNYSCLIQYYKQLETVQYQLLVEKHRIKLSSKNTENVNRIKPMMSRPPWKAGRERRQKSTGLFLNIGGYSHMTAKPGENVSLMCKFHTDPNMELTMLNIRWSKEGVTKWISNKNLLEDTARLEELSRGHASLNLTRVQRIDSGKYTCSIKYQILEKNISTILIVKDPWDENGLALTSPNAEKYRKEKIGMVVGVVVVVNCLAFFVYFCFLG